MTLHYILQVISFQLVFLLIFDLFLKRETFFTANRWYLIVTPLLSLVLPLIRFDFVRESLPQEMVVQLPAILVGGGTEVGTTLTSNYSILGIVWLIGMTIGLAILIIKVVRFITLTRGSIIDQKASSRVRLINNSDIAFSFMNTIYLGSELSQEQREHILAHEKVHVRQRHSLDLIFFELFKLLFWFNPLVYIFQRRLSVLHEYIADREVAMNASKRSYYQHLLEQTFQTDKISFINTFFKHSLIKKRIIMLRRSNSKKSAGLRYLLLLPVLGCMLIYTSCAQENDVASFGNSDSNDFTQAEGSEILANIAALQESIAARGKITDEERKALKALYALATEEGVNDFYFRDTQEDTSIPFGAIHKVPVYPGCEGLENEAAQKCFTKKVTEFVVNNFNTKAIKTAGIEGRQRIAVHFTISDQGTIKDVKAKAENAQLMDEAKRVVKMLPKMIPGEHDGKKVNVSYALPIIFEL